MKSGDIILTRSDSWISGAIRRFNSQPGEPALVSHAGLFLCEHHAIEALFRGVVTTGFPEGFTTDREWVIYSPLNVSDEDRRAIAKVALSFSARRYGYAKIAAQYLDWMMGTRFFTSKVFTWNKFPICSYLVAEAYSALALDFGVPGTSTTPDDILDFAVGNPDKYELLEGTPSLVGDISRTYGNGASKSSGATPAALS